MKRLLEALASAFDRAVELVGLDVDAAWIEHERRVRAAAPYCHPHRGHQRHEGGNDEGKLLG